MPGMAFCPGPLWNTTLTWDTDSPDFTACFHKTVLVYVPCGFLWLLSGLEFRANALSKKRFVRWSWMNVSKLTLDALLVLITVTKLALAVWAAINPVEGKDLVDGADFVAQTVFLATFVLDFALVLLAKRAGRVTSGSQFIFWLLLTVCQGFYMGSVVRSGEVSLGPDYHTLETIVVCFEFALTLLNLVVHCFADKTPIYTDIQDYIQNLSPETTSSFINRVLLLWFDKTVWKSRNKTIDFPDLWSLNPEDQIDKITSDWDRLWDEEMKNSRRLSRSPRILRVLFKAHWSSFLIGAMIQLLYVMLQFVNPLLLNLIITFIEGDEPYWRGFLYTAILSISGLTAAILDSHYWYKMSMIGFRVKTALTIAIYKKALVLSSSSRKEKTAGELVNMINVDCQKIIEASVFINIMWSSPLQVGISIYLLYQTIGVAIFVGLAVLIILFPVNSVIWAVMSKYQASQMKLKDSRVKLISEIMSGIKVIKLFAWELPFVKRINNLRLNEVNQLKVVQFLEGTQYFVWSIAPLLVALLSFMAYVLIDPINNILDTQTAFVSMTLFNTIRGPLFMLPYGIVSLIQAIVSLRRINAYFDLSDLDKNSVSHDEDSPHPISFKKASFKWNEKESDPTILNDISLDVHDGALVAVVGKVGVGKSSLISALLGEMTRSEGEVNIRGRVAYVPQQAWIRNETLKNNILFGKNFNGEMYNKVIEACALKPDLEILSGGDETEIGEKGINLSGGQKQRVSLARAVYNNADIYLLDDPLSAVDSNVGKHIFDKVIGPKGALRRKTRILVTHGIAFLPYVDQIIVLKDGRISESGTYEELMRNRGAFAEFLMEQLQEYDSDSSVSESEREDLRHKIAESLDPLGELANSPRKSTGSKQKRTRTKTTSIGSFGESYNSDQESILNLSYSRRRRTDSVSASRQTSVVVNDPTEFQVGRDLIEDEEAETKGVKIEVYIYYAKALGLGIAATAIFLYAIFQGCNIGGNFWLSIWAEDEAASTDTAVRNKYLGVYGALGFMQSMSVLVAVIVITIGTLRSSVKLHKELLEHILMSTMSFFDTTPLGRIINRFSKDIDEVDLMIPTHIKDILTDFFSVIGTLFVVSYASPIILTLVVPLIFVFFFIQNAYLATSRQLKRMVSVSTSPINSSMTESFNGAATIRAYKVEGNFIKENNSRVELNQRCYYPENVSDSWLFSRLESLANLLIIFTSLFSVIYRDTMDPGLTGLALTYTFTFELDIYLMTRYFAELEKSIVSVERIREYQQTETEAAFEKPESDPPKEWPESGKIEFDNYQTRYRTGLDLVLKGVSFKVIPGEKVGIVGRTGAGKSSLTLALFRLIEASGGCIKIDDIDISELGLMRLRSALTIIPQEPLLFSGTLRLNLDPFEKYTDAELWVTLEHAHLKVFVENLSDGLDYEIIEGGENLSVGQRQLVCLARALLRKTKILVLDEATAAVDLETDDLIQATIRSEFNDCTVLTIAHRLKTIMDNDKIILLDNGMVKEFDTPENLLRDKTSDFYSMAKDAGLV